MVSIPDWAKFSRTTDNSQKQDSTDLLNKYYKQRELEAIKQAEQTGYFLVPSEDYLLKHVGPYSGTNKELTKIFMARLVGLHLRKLGDLPLCSSLQICILANNFLTKVDALSSCQQLVKLDLHGNQLTAVPGPSFWSALRKLRALYLHDNPLGKFETLQSLSASPVLAILTLYDTPLYLKKNYRHHVVNSIWSLKALDHHVISDEEIIEDAIFGGHFSALSPSFKLDLCPPSPMDATYREEVRIFHRLEAQINHILAKHSPVVIVQRYLRGYYVRKSLGLVPPKTHQSQKRSQDVLMMPPVIAPGTQQQFASASRSVASTAGPAARASEVQGLRSVEVEQQETVKKYMEHRQLMRQTETAMARAALDTRMLQETTERLMEARQRVAHTKAKEATVQAFYPLPPSNIPQAVATAPAGMSRWEAGMRSQQGRVGRHHTILT